MNATMLNTAGGLCVLIGITHSYLGEAKILRPMFAQYKLPVLRGSDRATKNVMRFAWHLTSVAWWGLGVVLFVIASPAAESAGVHLAGDRNNVRDPCRRDRGCDQV